MNKKFTGVAAVGNVNTVETQGVISGAFQMARKVNVPLMGGYAHTFIIIAYSDRELKRHFTQLEAAKFETAVLAKDIVLGDNNCKKGDILRYRIFSANKSSGIIPELLVTSTYNNVGALETYATDKLAFMEFLNEDGNIEVSTDKIAKDYIKKDPRSSKWTRKGKWDVSYVQLKSSDNDDDLLIKNLINVYNSYYNQVTYNAQSAGIDPFGVYYGNCNTFSTSIADYAGATNYFPIKWNNQEVKQLNGLEMRGMMVLGKSCFPGYKRSK